jgi:hypothetical protein
MIKWKKEDAEAWAETLREPHMRKGLDMVKYLSRPIDMNASSQAMQPKGNVDYVALAALRAARYEGRQEVIDIILNMEYADAEPQDPLSPPFSYATEQIEEGEEE